MFQKKQEKFIKSQCQGFGGLAVIAGFAVSVIYLLIVMSVENTINLFGPEEYYLKLNYLTTLFKNLPPEGF